MRFDLHSAKSTIIRTAIFTFGHYWIDVLCNHFITGAPLHLAMVTSFASPVLNAIWYFILDRIFFFHILGKVKTGNAGSM